MTYEAGFAQGESDAYEDRANGVKSASPPAALNSPYQRGYWDAYTPRTSTWWRTNRQLEEA